ncbi:MAG: glycoside hydrolase [Clostridia bacterium]|nr:glycoside hydrolase [Clostridia bacterium]
MELNVKILENEYWYGGSVAESLNDPFDKRSKYHYDMNHGDNQTMPLFISTKGRYIWCEAPMVVDIENGEFNLSAREEIILVNAGKTLKDAYLSASRNHFKFEGKLPPLRFFETAQYNTWMELDYNQNQESILRYAHGIIDNGYEAGVLMIDEGWHTRYGLWEWDFLKFPDPKKMIDELHSLGFKVMLWVVPLVSSDGQSFSMNYFPYRSFLEGSCGDKEYFLRTDDGKVALVEWWNGFSAILNMCKKEDRDYLDTRLQRLIKDYGVDGFKFDGGNIHMYDQTSIVNGKQTKYTPDELNIAWNEFGTRYEYHEYKDTFKGGGKPVIQRLQDRNHSWTNWGINTIIPSALLQGLIGHPFICPDMVGGGEWSMNYTPNFEIDMELFVRMAQLSALFPMMQFSWAPWRVLDKKHAQICLESAKLHKEFSPYILKLVKEASVSGEPIVRHMEYEYPNNGYERVLDQFMLGSEVLVAPVIKKGEYERNVKLPKGKWLYLGKTEYTGNCEVVVPAPIDTLPYFLKKN